MNIIRYPEKAEWASIVERPHLDVSQLNATVSGILEDVKCHGDEAVIRYEAKFDHASLVSLAVTEQEIEEACRLAKDAGAHFVKTSTGFNSGGATAEDVALMKRTVGDALQVKASGGIRDYDTAMAMIGAGADRIGASASVNIMEVYSNVK